MHRLYTCVLLLLLGPGKSLSCPVAVEKGGSTSLECSYNRPVSYISWEMWDDLNAKIVTVTTCYVSSGVCSDSRPANYRGRLVSSSAGLYKSSLTVTSARVNETQFRCNSDVGIDPTSCNLEVYVWPSTPTCSLLTTASYVDVTCVIPNVYPGAGAGIHRTWVELTRADIDFSHSGCTRGALGSGSLGDYRESCTWRIPMENNIPSSSFYTVVFPDVTNTSSLNKPGTLSPLVPAVLGRSVQVEKGQNSRLDCVPNRSVVSVTWQLLDSQLARYVNISTCSLLSGTCTSPVSPGYLARVQTVGGVYHSYLDISRTGVNQTDLRCYYPGMDASSLYNLAVYVWPTTPSCSLSVTSTYVDIRCTTSNVYPGVSTDLQWTGNLSPDAFDESSYCKLGELGQGFLGDYTAECGWRIPLQNMGLSKYTFLAQMTPSNVNSSQANRPAAVSNEVSVQLSAPSPVAYTENCPVGSGVQGSTIKIGTTATCKCEIKPSGFLMGQARWYSSDGRVVGVENPLDRSSTLTVSFNSANPSQSYDCRAITILSSYYYITYTPTFVP